MSRVPETTLGDFMADFEADRIAAAAADEARYSSPEAVAAREARRLEDFERGVRLGWHDAEGNPLAADEEDDDDLEDEDPES